MEPNHFQFSFITTQSKPEVYSYLINPKNWWIGLHHEIIEGESKNLGDEFSFKAGDGMHYSNQKLVELEPDISIVWLVTESHLSFLKNKSEWVGTKICFAIEQFGNQTKVIFTHKGLLPEIECYGSCSSAWSKYLQKLALELK